MIGSSSCIEVLFVVLALLAAFLYETSSTFRYHTKFFLYYGLVIFDSILMIPIFLMRIKNVRNLVWAGIITRPVSSIIGMKWEIRGAEILNEDKSYIIVANHQSSLDVLGMLNIWHIMDKCTVVAKKQILYVFPFGLAAWLCGLIFIDRKHPQKAKDAINNAVECLKKNRTKLWIFPEGTRRNTREIHEFKKGAFNVAISAQLPILPVVYSSYSMFLDDKRRRLDQGHVIITALPPIPTEGLTLDDIDDLMERTRSTMLKTFLDTTKEAEAKMQGNNCNKKLSDRIAPKLSNISLRSSLRTVDLG